MYNDVKIIIALYVDDFLIFLNNTAECNKLKEILSSKFKIKDLGPVRQYLGMRITRTESSIDYYRSTAI